MGDRANVKIIQHDGDAVYGSEAKGFAPPAIWLYTHWGGEELAQTVQKALGRKQRWEDESYLARILFSEMIKENVEGETGFGISTYETDNEHPIITVDSAKQTVTIGPVEYPFAEFIALPEEKLAQLYQ